MNIFRDIQRKAASVHTKRQATYYKRLRKDTKQAQLQKAKLERLRQAKRERAEARAGVKSFKPKPKWRMPKLDGVDTLRRGIPTDEELNRAIFGAPSPRRPK